MNPQTILQHYDQPKFTEAMTKTLPLADPLFCTLQGEGPGIGQKAVFVRTMGCPLGCHWTNEQTGVDSWCDSAYTWKPGLMGKAVPTSIQAILD